MNRLWKIAAGAVLVAVVGAAVLGVAVYAQEATPQQAGSLGDYVDQMWDAVASKLGVERDDLDTAFKEARQEVTEQAVEDGTITQEQAERMQSLIEEGRGFGMRGFGMRGHPGGFWGGKMGAKVGGWMCDRETLAEQLGMTTDELAAELKAGKTITELAEEKGVDLQAARIEAMKEKVEQAVEDGDITQEQADTMLQGIEEGTFGGWKRAPFGGGMHGHFRGFKGPHGFWGEGDRTDPSNQHNQSNQTILGNQGNL